MPADKTVPAGTQWFAVHTLSGQEGKVKKYIEKFAPIEELGENIFEVLLPTEQSRRSSAARRPARSASSSPAMSSCR
jgi:transcriptional antiterminator NusG